MSTATTSRQTWIAFMRGELRDTKQPYQSEDIDYETALWQTVQFQNRHVLYARLHEPGIWRWLPPLLGDPWRVTVTNPVTGQSYEINEPAGIIFNPEGGETAASLTLSCTYVDVRRAEYELMMGWANNPAKAAIYMQSNGYVVDARQAPGLLREQAQHILGVH